MDNALYNFSWDSDKMHEGIYENSFKIEGYKNWVELAISFDA